MDDITVYGGSFEECMFNLETVLHNCIEKKLCIELGKMPFYGQPRNFVGAYYFRKRDRS